MSEGVCELIIPGQHTNLGSLIRSFTIGRYSRLHFKSEMGIPSGYIYFFVSPRTYTLIIQTYELDVRRGEAGEEKGIQMYEPDVRRGGGGGARKN